MKPFRFRLQSVLDFRARYERQMMAQLAAAEEALHKARMRREELQGHLEQVMQAEKEMRQESTVLGLRQLQEFGHYLGEIKQQLQQQEEQIEGCEENRRHCLQEFRLARQEREVIEKVRERQLELHHHQQRQREARQLDELSLTMWRRQQSEREVKPDA